MKLTADDVARWRQDPVAFIEECLRDPETNRPFALYQEQREFFKHAFELTPEGKMQYTELVFSAGKKSGKTGLGAMVVLFTAVLLAPRGGEIFCLANDLEQLQSRVFKAVAEILKVSPLRDSVDITASRIVFRPTGTTITAVANDFAGFSGANPTLNVYDELAYFNRESSRRLFVEGVPSPARKISFRLSVSTAGFDGEPSPLRDLYDRAMEHGTEIAPDLRVHENLLCYWTHEMRAPWQSAAWVAEMKRTYASRPSQFARLILNQWTSAESAFIPIEEWDRCVDESLEPLLAKSGMPIWVGLDLGLKHDSTAIVACGWDGDHIRIATHQVFIPRAGETLDIESTAEAAISSLRSRFMLMGVLFDPWQGIGLSQRLTRKGIKMTEFAQSPPNLSLMAGNLLELIKRRQIACYPSDDLRAAIQKCVAIENARGWRLGKSKAADRIDPVIALAMAALAAVQAGKRSPWSYTPVPVQRSAPWAGAFDSPRKLTRQEQNRIDDEKPKSGLGMLVKSKRWGRGGW